MTEYTFSSTTGLSEYKTNVQKATLYKLLTEILKMPSTVVFTENGAYETSSIKQNKVVELIEAEIAAIEAKHVEIVEAFSND